MADKNHRYAILALHHHGFLTRSDVTSRFIGHDKKDDIGRADIIAIRSGRSVAVEVKYDTDRFQFDNLRAPQRKWAEMCLKYPYEVPYWIYLTLGQHPPHFNNQRYKPRISWLFPYNVLLEIEKEITVHQKSMVYKISKGMNKQIQEKNLDAISLLEDYELTWYGKNKVIRPDWLKNDENKKSDYGGFWTIPEYHPFYKKFITQPVIK